MSDSKRVVKIQKIVDKYNIDEVKASYIVNSDEEYLNIDELKIKLDNPDMGKLPDWLTDGALDKMIWNAIYTHRNPILSLYKTEEDLYQELQLYVRKKSNKFENFKHLKALLWNYMHNEVHLYSRQRYDHFPISLNQPLVNGNNGDEFENNFLLEDGSIEDKYSDLVHTIISVKDEDIKKFLTVTGYLVCDIVELKDLYDNLYQSSKPCVQKKLKKLEDKKNFNDLLNFDYFLKSNGKSKRKVLSVKSVILALGFKKRSKNINRGSSFAGLSCDEILDYLRFYIDGNKILSGD